MQMALCLSLLHDHVQGIYLTLERQADGKNKLLRIRFNRNVYTKKEAEVWWNKSKHGLARAHNLAPGWLTALCCAVPLAAPLLVMLL